MSVHFRGEYLHVDPSLGLVQQFVVCCSDLAERLGRPWTISSPHFTCIVYEIRHKVLDFWKHQQHNSSVALSCLQLCVEDRLWLLWINIMEGVKQEKAFCWNIVRHPRCCISCLPLWHTAEHTWATVAPNTLFYVFYVLYALYRVGRFMSGWYCVVRSWH